MKILIIFCLISVRGYVLCDLYLFEEVNFFKIKSVYISISRARDPAFSTEGSSFLNANIFD